LKTIVQRVSHAEVRVDGKVIASINRGFLILIGFTHDESNESLIWTARKIAGLRIFEDDQGKMNRSLLDIGGKALIVPQFTLYADVRKGRRPAFVDASGPEKAEPLYDRFCDLLAAEGVTVEKGVFGARMEVELVNDGPVTIIIER